MKMTYLLLVAALMLGTSTVAGAACTPEELQKKSTAFTQAAQAKAKQDPQAYTALMKEFQPRLVQLQQQQNMDALCQFYDEATGKLR